QEDDVWSRGEMGDDTDAPAVRGTAQNTARELVASGERLHARVERLPDGRERMVFLPARRVDVVESAARALHGAVHGGANEFPVADRHGRDARRELGRLVRYEGGHAGDSVAELSPRVVAPTLQA